MESIITDSILWLRSHLPNPMLICWKEVIAPSIPGVPIVLRSCLYLGKRRFNRIERVAGKPERMRSNGRASKLQSLCRYALYHATQAAGFRAFVQNHRNTFRLEQVVDIFGVARHLPMASSWETACAGYSVPPGTRRSLGSPYWVCLKGKSTQATLAAMCCPALSPSKIPQIDCSGLHGIKSALPLQMTLAVSGSVQFFAHLPFISFIPVNFNLNDRCLPQQSG